VKKKSIELLKKNYMSRNRKVLRVVSLLSLCSTTGLPGGLFL